MELMKDTEEHEQFMYHGKNISNISDLVDAIKDSSEEEFKAFANEEKNDFANWVEHVLNSSDVANKLRTTTDKEQTVSILEEEIKSRNQNEVLDQHKEEMMSQEPKQKLGFVEDLGNDNDIKPPEQAQPEMGSEETKPEEMQTKEEPQVSEETKPEEIKEEMPPQETNSEVQEEPQEVKEMPQETNDKLEEVKAEPEMPQDKPEEETMPEAEPMSESDSTNVVTPIKEENAAKVSENSKPHHFCGEHFNCMRREFFFGMFIGLVVGIIAFRVVELLI